jgi:DNA-binding HxlR family transcriptional regulator
MAHLADAIGDRWTLLILRSALYGVARFEDFQGELGIGRSVLSDRLNRLVEAGLLTREAYQEERDRPRTEYRPAPAARALFIVFAAMQEWGDRALRRKAPRLRPRKKATREPLRVVFATAKGEIVEPEEAIMG